MSKGDVESLLALGFLTVVEDPEHGLFGGYLLLNAAGRPLEFHCTTPVKPNRAQRILYGPTLAPYLYGEQIGNALVSKSAVTPQAICCDLRPVLAVRPFTTAPVALVVAPDGPEAGGDAAGAGAATGLRFDAGHVELAGMHVFTVGANRLAVDAPRTDDAAELASRLAGPFAEMDLSEPFNRIRDAIGEAQRGGR